MINPKILVTGATGKTGRAIVRELLAKGVPVRAMVRTLDLRSAALEARGAEVVVADIFDPGQLMDAMRGAQRAYYCPPYHPFVIQSASAFAAAAREAGLEQIVGLSQWLAGPNHPSLMTRQLWLIDRMFAALPGIAHTIVNPGFFADSPYLEMMPFAAHLGVLPLPVAGESRTPRPQSTISLALRSRSAHPMLRYANSPEETPKTSKRSPGATRPCQNRAASA